MGCVSPLFCRQLCRRHYGQARRGVLGNLQLTNYPAKGLTCSVGGCTRECVAKNLCDAHYQRKLKGKPLDGPIAKRQPGVWGAWKLNTAGYLSRLMTIPGELRQVSQLQHRYVMEQSIGRSLLPEETVHHVNGVKVDNRIENLELWSSNHPSGQRVADILKWAHEMIELYS